MVKFAMLQNKLDKPRLVLHIGGAKCGSTAIQDSFTENFNSLKSAGVLIPDNSLEPNSPISGHQVDFFSRLLDHADAALLMRQSLRRLADHMNDCDMKICIISAENLINESAYAQMAATSLEMFDVTVVLYVRRQDDWLISAWQQWFLKQFDTFHAFYEAAASNFCNWGELIVPWENVFGPDRIIVRPFNRLLLTAGNVVDDFYHAVQLPVRIEDIVKRNSNPSYDEALGELASRNRSLFEGLSDNQFYDVYLGLLGPAAFKSHRGSALLSHQQRLAILERFAETNSRLIGRYIGEDIAAVLFGPPALEDCIEVSEIERLRNENTLLARAIFNLGQRLWRQENKTVDSP